MPTLQPLSKAGRQQHKRPLVVLLVLLMIGAALPPTDRPVFLAVSGALALAIILWLLFLPWERSSGWFRALPILGLIALGFLLRWQEGEFGNGFSALGLLAIGWLIVYGNKQEIIVGVALFCLLSFIPVIFDGDEVKRALILSLLAAGSAIIGRQLVDYVRAGELAQAAMIEHAPEAFAGVDHNGVIIAWNPAAEQLTGFTAEEIVGTDAMTALVPVADWPAYQQRLHDAFASVDRTVQTHTLRMQAQHKDGHQMTLDLVTVMLPGTPEDIPFRRLRPWLGEHPEPPQLYMHARDISAQALTERLRAMETDATSALALAADLRDALPKLLEAIGSHMSWDIGAYWHRDNQNQTLSCMYVWSAGTGAPILEARCYELRLGAGEGLPGRALDAASPTAFDLADAPDTLREEALMTEGMSTALEIPVTHAGEPAGVLEFLSREPRQPGEDELYELSNLSLRIDQFLERVSYTQQLNDLQRSALIDPDTRVANEQAFRYWVGQELARAQRENHPLSLLVLRPSGRPNRDQLNAWQQELRATDMLACTGPQQFFAVLASCPASMAELILSRLRASTPELDIVSESLHWDGRETSDELIQRAHTASDGSP